MPPNPYDSPTATDATPAARQSRRPYYIATSIVLLPFVLIACVVAWFTDARFEGNEIWFFIPGESVSTSPYGDPIIAYDRMVYTTIGGVVMLCVVLVALSLAIVNGLILFWRR